MAFPMVLTPSPVSEAFIGIQTGIFEWFDLSEPEKALLRAGENVPHFSQEDARAYVNVLLKFLDQGFLSASFKSSMRVSTLSLARLLPDDEALEFVEHDRSGVVNHYAITKLTESIQWLRAGNKAASLASVFYPNGTILENWRPLLRMLLGGGRDEFAQRTCTFSFSTFHFVRCAHICSGGAGFCLSCILLEGCRLKSAPHGPLDSMVSWMISRLQSSSGLAVVNASMTILLESQKVRLLFDAAGGIGCIGRRLRSTENASVQQVYEMTYCLWLMSFECNDSVRRHFHMDGTIAALVDVLSASPREKVVRCALAALRNLAICGVGKIDGKSFLRDMVAAGLIKVVDHLKRRHWSDPDVLADLELLHSLLHAEHRDMTRWDVYQSEIESSHLQWSTVHSEKFFRENILRMEGKDGNFGVVRILLRLAVSGDEEVAAIACYDIGEFARHYPNGRAVARRLGAREIVMRLIESKHDDLQRQALLCMSKMLVQKWDVRCGPTSPDLLPRLTRPLKGAR